MKCPMCGSAGELLFSSFACNNHECPNGSPSAPVATPVGIWLGLHAGVHEVPFEHGYERARVELMETPDAFENRVPCIFQAATDIWASGRVVTDVVVYADSRLETSALFTWPLPHLYVIRGGNTPCFDRGNVRIPKLGVSKTATALLRSCCL